MGKIPVNDNHNEVLRKAAQDSADGTKYDLRVTTGDLVFGVHYDTITMTEPTTSSELYTYTLSAATVRTVTITYTDSSKETLSTVVVA